jgi:hypothetical protein
MKKIGSKMPKKMGKSSLKVNVKAHSRAPPKIVPVTRHKRSKPDSKTVRVETHKRKSPKKKSKPKTKRGHLGFKAVLSIGSA